MDEAAIDAPGCTPLAPLLADIAAIRDGAGIERIIRRLHELAIPAAFVVTGGSDYNDPASVIVNISAGGLGLPDRDYYLKAEKRFAEARERYRAHVATVLALGGMPESAARKAAEDILALETRLAEASSGPRGGRRSGRDRARLTFAQLAAGAGFDWSATSRRPGCRGPISTSPSPRFLQRAGARARQTPVAVWKAYLTLAPARVGVALAGQPFAESPSVSRTSTSAAEMKPRAMRCLESTEASAR